MHIEQFERIKRYRAEVSICTGSQCGVGQVRLFQVTDAKGGTEPIDPRTVRRQDVHIALFERYILLGRRGNTSVTSPEQPRDSDLEHLVSLRGRDVQAIDAAVLAEVTLSWAEASVIVKSSHEALLSSYPLVPDVFFLYRLRKLVGAGVIEATGTVDRKLNYQVRAVGHAPAT